MIKSLIVFYLVLSCYIAISDLFEMAKQEKYINSIPAGDVGEFVSGKPVMGIHNVIFLPSLLIIILYTIFVCVVNNN